MADLPGSVRASLALARQSLLQAQTSHSRRVLGKPEKKEAR